MLMKESCISPNNNEDSLQQVLRAFQVWNLEILPKHRENTGNFHFSRSLIGLPTQFCVCNSHKLCKLAQGKCAVGQGKHREFENTI